MSAEFDSDPYTDALREDLPSPQDEARVRTRLVAAGVLAGVGAVAPGATAAATTGTAAAGLLTKALALPLVAKLGATAVLLGAVAVPVVRAQRRSAVEPAASRVASARTTATPGASAAAMAPNATMTAVVPAPLPSLASGAPDELAPRAMEPAVTAAPVVAAVAPVTGRSARERASESTGAPVAAAHGAGTASLAVGSFPLEAMSEDEGTLRAETALMEQALGALKRGDYTTAKQRLAEHARTFPNGHLAPERDRALERVREKETSP